MIWRDRPHITPGNSLQVRLFPRCSKRPRPVVIRMVDGRRSMSMSWATSFAAWSELAFANHLALLAAVLSARQRDVQTVRLAVQTLHPRFKALFSTLGLQTMEEWDPSQYLPPYMQGDLLPKDGPSVRQAFLGRYNSATRQVWGWLETLPTQERERYQPLSRPVINPLLMEALSQEK